MRRILQQLLLVLILALSVLPSSAQVQTGTPPFGSFGGGPDVINLANLNSHIAIPILHRPGRGTDFTYDLSYDSSVWQPVTSGSTVSWQPATNQWGWQGLVPAGQSYITYTMSYLSGQCYQQQHYQQWTFSNFLYYDQLGTFHSFGGGPVYYLQSPGGIGCPPNGPYPNPTPSLTDGLGYTLYPTLGSGYVSAYLVYKDGTKISPPVLSNPPSQQGSLVVNDRNGNEVTVSNGAYTDTLGTQALALVGTAPANTNISYTAPDGTKATYVVSYTAYTIATNFGVSGINEYKSSAAVSLVTSIGLPDGSQYTFQYESTPGTCSPYSGTTCTTARVTSVKLPTGGTISYSYSFTGCTSGNNGILSDGSTSCLQRTTPDGTWTYVQTKQTGAASTTTITAPQLPYDTAANQTVIQFQGIYETQRKVYQGSTSSTLLSTVNTCYNQATSPCTGTAITLPISQRTVNATIPGAGSLQSLHTDKYDNSENLIESDDYDLATGSPFPLVRQTLISYANLGNGLNSFIQTVKVLDGGGNPKSREDITYDQYGSGLVCVTGAPQHDDTGHGCSFTARANATSVTTYTDPVTPSGGITKNFTYDSLGNLRTAQLNCCQQKTWAYSAATDYAYPDSITSGSSSPQLTTSFTYDLHMGLTLTITDPNNVQTTLTYDSLGRPLTAKTGTNPAATFTYNDSSTWTFQFCSPVQGTNTACQKTILDSQGRPATTQLLDGSGTLYSASDVQYDPVGRAYKSSNPYTGSPAYWTQTNFDALGRPYKTTLPDNSVNTTSYTDNTATAADPTGKQRKFVTDGLGRLTSVYEPDPSNGNTLTLQTSYAYNVANQLTQVTQGVQTRTYSYDALWRLVSATTPEAGMVCFGTLSGGNCQQNGYDNFNNLLYRTDARGVVTNYLYDSLNRLTGVTYLTVPSGVAAMPNVCKANGSSTNNANVCLTYGTSASSYNNGRLVSMTDTVGSESYTYNSLEQLTQLQKVINGTTYTTSYSYNLANELTQITYPSNRVVVASFDAIGRRCAVGASGSTCTTGTLYASGFAYNVTQQVTDFKYGNGIFASFGFSPDRLQLICLDYSTTSRNGTCTHDSTTKFGLNYSYGSAGSNNGQISAITDGVDSGRNAAYTYDALYRLTTAVTAGSTAYPQWGLQWAYDRYGNRSAQSIYSGCSGLTCPTNSVTVSASTNQLTGSPFAYDLAGNMTNDGNNTLTYDGENHAATSVNGSNSGTYTYDGKGLRVKKVSVVSGVTTTTVYVFSGSKVIAEYDNGAAVGSPSREYIYSGGQRIATIQGTTTTYQHSDQVSVRLLTDASGNEAGQRGHFPYGETWYEPGTLTKVKFTTYERDAESGNDYAMDRTYVNRLGRFSSVDPLSGNTSDPQSLNRYAYTLNDPINLTDPTGDDGSSDGEQGGGDEGGDVGSLPLGGPGPNDPVLIPGPLGLPTDPGCTGDTAPGGCASVTADAPSGDPGSISDLPQAPDLGQPDWVANLPDVSALVGPPRQPPPPQPNACDPAMIAAFRYIWSKTMRFPTQQREAGFAMNLGPTGIAPQYVIGPIVKPVPGVVPHASITINPPGSVTLDIAHTHPDSGTPSAQDRLSPVPNFVVSLFSVIVTDPMNPTPAGDRQVRGSDWSRPCP
jgi:RHS repeat-associated protein